MKRFSLQTKAAGPSVYSPTNMIKYEQYVAVKLKPCVCRPMSATETEDSEE